MAAVMCGRCARKLQHLRTPWHSSVRLLCAPSSSLSLESDDNRYIEASSAKKRDPLAVLKVLASTVRPVPNLSNPEFVEDIFLLPRSKDKQDACLAAKQSGRKAAEFVISRCPGIFPLRTPNPEWISGLAKATDSKTESDLKYFIKATDAKNAILSFERLKEQGVEVSLDTQNDLLDLTAQRLGNIPAKQVFGFEEVSQESDEPLGKGLEEDVGDSESNLLDREEGALAEMATAMKTSLENKHFRNGDYFLRRGGKPSKEMDDYAIATEWRKDSYAMEMFHSMETKNGKTYEAMVLGLLKYRCYLDAYDLFNEMRQLGYQGFDPVLNSPNFMSFEKASLFTYNLLFRAISKSRSFDSKWEKAKELIKNMAEEPVVLPNLKTYNALMKIAVVSSETDNMSRTEIAFGILRDMKAAGLDPSLESYNQLIRAEYITFWEKKRQSRSSDDHRLKGNQSVSPAVLNKIITYLESLPKLPPLRDPEDAFFFRSAMSASLLCVDAKLAIRIFKLVEKQDNASYLGEKRGLFYSAFLLTLTSSDADFSLIYDYYKDIVPHKYRPKDHVYTSLFNWAYRTNNPGVVKRFYDDMRKHRIQLTAQVSTAMFKAMGKANDPKHIKTNVQLMLDVLRWMKVYRVEITHVHITLLIRMLCKNDQLEDAWKALDMFKRNRVPIPTYHALNDILVKASQEKDKVKVIAIFEMMAKYGYNLNRKRRLALYDSATIPTIDRSQIDELFSDMSILDERRRQYFPDKQEGKLQDDFDLVN